MDLDGDGWKFLPLLKRRIVEQTGLDCTQFKDKYFRRRIAVRMRALNIDDCGAYARILRSDEAEQDKLLKDITINVTSFFRDPEVFEMIERDILPEIVYRKMKEGRRVIRIWSAGCASGEEAYSLAILLLEILGRGLTKFVVSVLGTDIDEQSLAMAKKGEYLASKVEDVDPELLEWYFDTDGEKYQVTDDVRSLVRFRHSDLFSDKKERYFDMILCRNVAIYFSKKAQAEVYADFHNSLTNRGYLILGKTEMLLGDAKELFDVIDGAERIYQKRPVRS